MTGDLPLTSEDEQRRLIVEAAENGLLIVDAAGRIELANSAAERLFGYSPGALLGQSAEILECAEIRAAAVPSPEPATYVDPLGKLLAFGGDLTARRAGGGTVSIEITSRNMNTQRGPLVLFAVGDVLERRRAHDGGSPDTGEPQGPIGRWRYDLASGDFWWSDEICRIYGLPATARPTLDGLIAGFDPADRARIGALVDGVIRDGTPYRDEARILRLDGSTRTVLCGGDAERALDGEITAITGLFQDTTERDNAQRERLRLGEYVRLANQAGKIGIWELDLRTNVSVWDLNMYALYGVSDITTVPTFEFWTTTLHPHDRDRAVREVKTDISGGAPSDS